MGVNLLEASKLSALRGETLKSSVAKLYAGSSSILENLEFTQIAGLSQRVLREIVSPSAGFREVNGGFDDTDGSIEDFSVSLALSGGNVDVDMILLDGFADANVRAQKTEAKVRALGLNWTRVFMKGDSSLPFQNKEFDGLQKRLGDPAFSEQVIDAGNTSGGDALSLEKLDELIDLVDGDNKKLVMNKTMARRITQASRNQDVGGYVVFEPGQFGRRLMFYNGIEILTIDRDHLRQPILPFTEANPGGGIAASTSVYCLNFHDTGVYGIDKNGINVRDFGELEDGRVMRTKIDWSSNFVIHDIRSAARLRGIKNAAIVV